MIIMSYCAAPAAQCARTGAAQALQFLLLAASAHRVLQLTAAAAAATTARRTNALFSLHALLATLALGLAAATLLLLLLRPSLPPALLVTSGLDALSWGFYTSLLCLEHARARGRQSEPVLLLVIFAAIYDLLGVLYDDTSALSADVKRLSTCSAAVVAAVATVGALRKWVLWRASEVDGECSSAALGVKLLTHEDSPFDRAGLLSRIAYSWVSPFIALGLQRRFEVRDVPALPARDATAAAARVFRDALERELRSPAPSFLRATRHLYGAEVLFFAAWSTLNKAIGLASPVLIKLFLDWADEKEPSLASGYWLAAAMVARSVLASVSGTQYALAWKRFDIRVRAGVISAIYARSLALSSSAQRRYGLGRITNLVSVDLGRLVGMPGTVFDMFLIPGEIVVALFLLSREVSYAFVAGVAVLGAMLPIQTLLGGKIQSVTASMLAFRDARVSVTAESLKAIKPLKLLAWVNAQLEKMDALRELEMGRLAVRKYLDALCVFFWASTPVIVQTSVFAAVIYSGHDITAANAFTAVSLLDRLVFPMNYFPWIINGFLEARVSALRIREFLFASEVFVAPRARPPSKATEGGGGESGGGGEPPKNAVEISDCIFTWDQQGDQASEEEVDDAKTPLMHATEVTPVSRVCAFELSLEHLFLQQHRDYVVCGPVGAGKSSLLLALLGEMRRQSGHFSVLRRRAAYAPQTPWLFRGSVRQNITLCEDGAEEPIDEALYRHVLRVCELEQDLRAKPAFDRAEVGENGSNLSGGQRLRINLARALYQRTGLYLLDDPFSGLDARTATKIVTSCFGSASQRAQLFPDGATVVLVTHSIHLLELFPRDVEVVVMESGEVIESGAYESLAVPGSATRLQAMVSEANRERQHPHSSSTDDPDGAGDSSESVDGVDVVSATSAAKGESNESPDDNDSNDDHSEEHREAGVVNPRVWKAYASSIGWPLSLTILLSVAVMQVSRNGLDWWIGVYTNAHRVSPRVFADTLVWITVVNCTAVFFRSFLFAFGGLRAARSVYSRLVASVFSAALSFFDATPVGRILNRLSGDTYAVDESLPFILNIFLKDLADVLGALAILLYGNKLVLLLLVPLSAFYLRLQQRYRPAARHVRRLDAVAQSPILTMFTETLEGLHVIRAMQLQHEYAAAYGRCLDLSQKASFLGANTGAWFGIRLDMLGVCVTSFVAVSAVAEFHVTGAVNPGILGLTLTYALPIVSKLNAVLGSFIDTEQQMIAVERVKEYTDLPDEEAVVSNGRKPRRRDAPSLSPSLSAPVPSMSSVWPRRGEIEFTGLTVSYAVPGSARGVTALSGISCRIGAGEKVGVCGRTGAGKSTFLNAIFRAVTWRSGSVSVDGVSLETLSLRELRSKLTYIPQEAVLFSGTVRSNLDPEGRCEDHALWAALVKCGLDTAVAKLARGLESPIEAGDATLSKGQSQLLCIARALLRPSKVLCIDEATASVDLATEQLVAKTIEREFADSTVVTVAHRIQTIMGCGRVLVFDHGRLVESGEPRELAADPSSMFHGLANSGSDATLL